MQTTSSNALADFLDRLAGDLSDTLRQAARLAEHIQDPTAALPPVLRTRHIAEHQDISTTTVWRRALAGAYGPLLSGPGEPIRIARDTYLNSLRARPAQGQPANAAACDKP
jgi:hypothetical protein